MINGAFVSRIPLDCVEMNKCVDSGSMPQETLALQPLLTRLSRLAAGRPDHAAFVEGEKSTCFGELWERIVAIGQGLRVRISPGDRVALLMDNSADCAAALYGIWWAGGIAVPLNNALKSRDLGALLGACGAQLVIVDARSDQLADALPGALSVAGLLASPPSPAHSSGAAAQPSAGDTAVLIFTSGTTGQPKGVMLSHANLSANVCAIQQTLPMQADDVTLCVLPFHYAYGGSVLHTHLTLGATLVLENSFMYPQRIVQRMAEREVTAFYGVPSSFYLLMERGHLSAAALPRLRYLAQAGAAMPSARIEQLGNMLPQAPLWVMYGQTEACSRLTTLSPADRLHHPGSAGLPLPGVTLSIQDEQGRHLKPGEIGEVCARGPNVMQGYWRSPDDTASALRDGWLHTGDLGHLDEGGFLFLQGRSRDILKIGAHRVAPQEIEHLIQGIPGVQECAVVALPDDLLGEVPRACVIPQADHRQAPAQAALRQLIQRTCREQLALYKCPRQVDFFQDLPRTASGKVQKHLIPQPSTLTPAPG